MNRPRMARVWAGGVFLLGVILIAGCSQAPPAKTEKTVEVVVTTPISHEVVDYQDFTGRLDAYRTVEIRPRVSGYLRKNSLGKADFFKEGDLVEEGKELFRIEPKPFEVDVAAASANVSLSIAERNLQELNSGRARRLMNTQTIAKEEYDQIMASREKANASTQAMAAAQEKARINLGYTRVLAPIKGRISRRVVDPGNLVKADETLLTTIVDDHLVYAYFDVDERTYLDLVGEKPTSSAKDRVSQLHLPVLMRLANEEKFTHAGRVDFVDNRLNGTTGTIRLRGVFENPYGNLKSGLFVRIRLPIGQPYKPLLVPDEALQSDQGQKFVYAVNAEGKVEYHPLEVGQAIPGLRTIEEKDEDGKVTTREEKISLRIIKKGMKPGEQVIVTGMQKVRPKLKVQTTREAPPKPVTEGEAQLLNLTRAAGGSEKGR